MMPLLWEIPCRLETILLIDNVMTTGSTLNAAAKILKASGAERVSAWVLCRSVIGKDSRALFQ